VDVGGTAAEPGITYVNYLDASANFQLGEFDAAEQSALQVEKSRDLEFYPLTLYILGVVDAHHGRFEPAAARFRRFLQTHPDPAPSDAVKELLGQWEQDGRIKYIP
jgi:hypothetical protein